MNAWWRWRRREHRGALVALRVDGKLLLVRSSYKVGWSFPGGGIEGSETAEAAAARELREEIGLDIAVSGPPVMVTGFWEGWHDTVHVFEVTLERLPELRLDNREVIGAQLVAQAELGSLALSGPVRGYLEAKRALLAAEDDHAGL